jgi:uncharacterized protein YbaR (Trm112 family)
MLNDSLLALLRCPENHSEVHPANEQLVARLNAAIRAGRVRNQAGIQVTKAIDGGLVRAAGDLLYPIVDQIPVMLHDEAIPLELLGEWRMTNDE